VRAGITKPSLADALCSSTGTGGVEARSRCAHRPSTRAGPCDAVIDVVRSRRLESSALTSSSCASSFSRPSSLPSPSFFASSPCCPPSLSEWRPVQCPRGSRTLHSDYYSAIKKPAFSLHAVFCCSRQHHILRDQRALPARRNAGARI
jgi:hypothetical protein